MSMEAMSKLIFTSAVPIVVQFGGYGFLAAVLCMIFGFCVEIFLIGKMLHQPYVFVFKRLALAHAIAFFVQITVAVVAAALLGLFFTFFGKLDITCLYRGWVILTLIMTVVIVALLINMVAQYFVLRWKHDGLPAAQTRKAVLYAGIINYVLTIGFLAVVDNVSPILKNNRMQEIANRAGIVEQKGA